MLILLLALLLTSCAPTFTRAPVPLEPQAQHLAECRQRVATVPAGPQLGGVAGILFLVDYKQRRDRVLADCMAGKGWTVTP